MVCNYLMSWIVAKDNLQSLAVCLCVKTKHTESYCKTDNYAEFSTGSVG